MTTARAPDTTALEDALAQRLHALGLVRYEPSGVYGTGTLPAVFFGIMPDAPSDAIVINTYNDDRSRDPHNPDYYVQLRFRTAGCDKRTTDRLAEAVFDALDDFVNERTGQAWPGVRVLHCHRHIRGASAPDANSRWSRPDSYTITVNPS